jgi:hypothetical protein
LVVIKGQAGDPSIVQIIARSSHKLGEVNSINEDILDVLKGGFDARRADEGLAKPLILEPPF